MNTIKEELTDWLRDAYGMERALEVALKKQSENDELNPVVREQARIHLDETRRHAEAVQGCLERLGTETSALKSSLAVVGESLKGLASHFSRDERIKDILCAYASEHFEIACYRALQTAAAAAGEPSIVEVCESIIRDEQKMAQWLGGHLPEVVTEYLKEQQAREQKEAA